jgi:hypothetical protein
MPHTLLHTLAALRFQAHTSFPEHRSDARAFEVTRGFLEGGYRALRAGAEGDLHTYARGEQIRGYLMHWRQAESWYGAPTHTYALDFDWADPDAARWATQALLAAPLSEDAELMLSARYAPLLGVALGAGLRLDSVVLLGDPRRSLERLMSAYAPPPHLGALNLDVRPLRTQTEVDLTVALKRRYFSAHPEHCWFGANARVLQRAQEELSEALRAERRGDRPPARAWVLYREGAFMGSFSYSDTPDHPLWGALAGVDITLHPLIQRRGVVKTAYRVMLTAMLQAGVQVYKGGTSQPAVMALGRVMGRPLFSWVLRRRAALPARHFSPYLPPHLRALERSSHTEEPL